MEGFSRQGCCDRGRRGTRGPGFTCVFPTCVRHFTGKLIWCLGLVLIAGTKYWTPELKGPVYLGLVRGKYGTRAQWRLLRAAQRWGDFVDTPRPHLLWPDPASYLESAVRPSLRAPGLWGHPELDGTTSQWYEC